MARARLAELVRPESYLASTPDTSVEKGAPAETILRIAEGIASDLIVIGARGAGALARLATHFGSIAHKIVSHAACPVLTVGEPKCAL
jgi:nucleotide-binding universal stress UspA family protein